MTNSPLHPLPESLATPAEPTAPAEPLDPFDLAGLRVSQNFTETAGVKKLLTTVPVRRPSPQDFVRVHPDPEYRETLGLIEIKDDRESYLVQAAAAPDLIGEMVTKSLYVAINRQGVVFFWPVTLPGPDGRQMEWHRSAAEAAELAMTKWVRLKANMSLGAYEIFIAEGNLPDPTWPDLPYKELLRIAFRDKLVTSLDHPVVKRLRGLV